MYLFSIFAELGIFDSFHYESATDNPPKFELTNPVYKVSTDGLKKLARSGDFGECSESTCHTGHCHHISTFYNQTPFRFSDRNDDHKNIFGDNYSFQFARGIKRPPRKV